MKKRYVPPVYFDADTETDEPPKKAERDFKPECANCTYLSIGFICRNTSDGTCLKDWRKGIFHGSGSHAGG